MARVQLLVLLVGVFVALASASSAPTFCKCTCFKNSTIIALGPSSETESASTLRSRAPAGLLEPIMPNAAHGTPREPQQLSPRSKSASCSACTKAFCLKQGIDFCKDAEEEDVMTTCFQRDSNKDKFIVWGFILGTIGLLGWAAFKRVAEWRNGRAMGRQGVGYDPVSPGR